MKFSILLAVAAGALSLVAGCTGLEITTGTGKIGGSIDAQGHPSLEFGTTFTFGQADAEADAAAKAGPDDHGNDAGAVESMVPVKASGVASGTLVTTNLKLDAEQQATMAIVANGAALAGIDPADFVTLGFIESRLRPDARPPLRNDGSGKRLSTAAGVLQFLASTAAAYGLKDPLDPVAATVAGTRLWADNMAVLEKAIGQKPSAALGYLAWQQGAGTAVRLATGGNILATSIAGVAAIRYNVPAGTDWNTLTADEFVALWEAKFAATRAHFRNL